MWRNLMQLNEKKTTSRLQQEERRAVFKIQGIEISSNFKLPVKSWKFCWHTSGPQTSAIQIFGAWNRQQGLWGLFPWTNQEPKA